MSTFLSLSFSIQAIFGVFLFLVGDFILGPLFVVSGCYAARAVDRKQKVLTAGCIYMLSILLFFVLKVVEAVQVNEMIQSTIGARDRIEAFRDYWIIIITCILFFEITLGTITLVVLRRFYLTMEQDIPELPEKQWQVNTD